jgi:hypothetical protein
VTDEHAAIIAAAAYLANSGAYSDDEAAAREIRSLARAILSEYPGRARPPVNTGPR